MRGKMRWHGGRWGWRERLRELHLLRAGARRMAVVVALVLRVLGVVDMGRGSRRLHRGQRGRQRPHRGRRRRECASFTPSLGANTSTHRRRSPSFRVRSLRQRRLTVRGDRWRGRFSARGGHLVFIPRVGDRWFTVGMRSASALVFTDMRGRSAVAGVLLGKVRVPGQGIRVVLDASILRFGHSIALVGPAGRG